jgi:hypothetical protein
MLFRRVKEEAYAALRKKIIRETETALLYGVLFPERVPRIPVVEVGTARFHPEFARQWWDQVLSEPGSVAGRTGAAAISGRH